MSSYHVLKTNEEMTESDHFHMISVEAVADLSYFGGELLSSSHSLDNN